MCGSVLCLAFVALGIDAGWQPLPDGGLEYIIQIEPHNLKRLERNSELVSDIDPKVKGVRSVRIRVGTDELPHRSLPDPAGASLAMPEDASALRFPGPLPGPSRHSDRMAGGPFRNRSPSNPPPQQGTSTVPGPIELASGAKPIGGQPAADIPDEGKVATPVTAPSKADPTEETIPPLAWTVTLGALVASLGGMLYLGWVALDYRARYRRLLDRLFEGNRQPWLGEGA